MGGSCRDKHRQTSVPCGVHRAAEMLRTAVDMRRCRDRLAANRGAAERGVQIGVLVRNSDELRRLAALRLGLGDRLLVESDLGARGEEHELDAGLRHRRDDGLTVVGDGDFDPFAALVPAAVDVIHGGVLAVFSCRIAAFTRRGKGGDGMAGSIDLLAIKSLSLAVVRLARSRQAKHLWEGHHHASFDRTEAAQVMKDAGLKPQ